MAKAILVVDMPDNCYQCRLWHIESEDGDVCGIDFDTVNPRENERPDWCPLINFPDDIDGEKLIRLFYKLYDKIVEDSNYGKSKQATLKLIADGIELLNIMGMNEE